MLLLLAGIANTVRDKDGINAYYYQGYGVVPEI